MIERERERDRIGSWARVARGAEWGRPAAARCVDVDMCHLLHNSVNLYAKRRDSYARSSPPAAAGSASAEA